jgi:hypothetical protein
METLTFNTGRMYGHTGQRVAAALLDNGDIIFTDRDRFIEGLIQAGGLSRDDVKQFKLFEQREIMRAYDAGDYKNADNYNDEHLTTLRAIRMLADNVKGA